MVDANIFVEKLKQLSSRIEKARSHCPANPVDLAADSDTLDLVSFNLLLAVQTCLDLATHLIAEESWAPAATAREAFERLEENGVISNETAALFGRPWGCEISLPIAMTVSIPSRSMPLPQSDSSIWSTLPPS